MKAAQLLNWLCFSACNLFNLEMGVVVHSTWSSLGDPNHLEINTCFFPHERLKSFFVLISQVLVLAPTREIAVQIHSVVMAIGCAMEGLECHVFIGGRPVSQDKHHLKKCHIAVGSPGKC